MTSSEPLTGLATPATLTTTTDHMTYWKYLQVSSTEEHGMPIKRYLDHLGSEGWEMVSAQFTGTDFTYFFKRPNIEAEIKMRMKIKALHDEVEAESRKLLERWMNQP